MIYGPDSQSVQQAREQLELFEETFTLQPAQADWLSEKTNTSILSKFFLLFSFEFSLVTNMKCS